jgi:hypothetical protein
MFQAKIVDEEDAHILFSHKSYSFQGNEMKESEYPRIMMICLFLNFCFQQSTVVSENTQRLSDSHTASIIFTQIFLYLNLLVYRLAKML